MSNNVVLNSGAGGSTIATEQNGVAEQYQKIKITDGTAGAFTNMAAVTAGSALKVDNSAVNQPVVGPGAAGSAVTGNPVRIAGSDGTNTQNIATTTGGLVKVDISGTTANATAVKVDGSAVTQPVSAAALPLPTGASTAAKQPALGIAGTASADVLTVQGITSMTALKVDGSAVTQPVSAASLPLPTGAATAAKQPALGTAGSASADVLSVQGVASMTALKVDGSAVTQPVSLTSTTITGTVAVTESGTWTVQPGNTANTTAWLVTQTPSTSGGLSTQKYILAATTNGQTVKASAGQLYGLQAFNNGSAPVYVKIYNKASAPTVGTDIPVKVIEVPANATAANGAGVAINFGDSGVAFATGIAIAVTGGIADADTTATAANQGVVNFDYK